MLINYSPCSEREVTGMLAHVMAILSNQVATMFTLELGNNGGTQRQFLENICSEDDLRSRIFGTFVVKFLACLPLLGFSNI